jgi:hypothetical protein
MCRRMMSIGSLEAVHQMGEMKSQELSYCTIHHFTFINITLFSLFGYHETA